ncbi:C40 family peptidase [Nesterenkonia sphaerica]|uniref:NlpC/P60 family protein n=1 Tax=Nesterenkonia sphaerica TaxID=1804988 RepID=A0A5R9A966_9MICC|nr:C40 family peptidase [Nesterenkonia sphaerica]TLP74336.1 NlpC/P60 family protein [Nesterenkonia sphaerica]
MKHPRNLAAAAVTAAVVTTALVGTTLVADRTSDDSIDQATDQALSAETLVRTDLPEVPSADDISTARESQDARDSMMVDIVGRIDQAIDRADELELELMRQHSLAQARLQEAADLQQEAEDAAEAAEAAMAMDASEEYQEGDTSAADVLLGDEDALAEDATDQQRSDQAEREAVDAAQLQREAEAASDAAASASEEAAATLASTGTQSGSTQVGLEDLDNVLRDLLDTLREEEGFEGSLNEFLTFMYGENDRTDGGSGYFDADGNLDGDALRERIRQLRAAGPQVEVAAAEETPDTTEDSSDDAEGEATSSEESEVTEPPSLESLSSEQRRLLSQAAELENFDSTSAYYRVVLSNSDLTSGGTVDWDAFSAHVDFLNSQSEEAETDAAESTPSPSPTSTPSPSPTASPSPSPTATTSSVPGYNSLSSGQQSLLSEAADLEPDFDGGARDYYTLLQSNDLFTTSSGAVNWTVLEGHVSYLNNQAEARSSAQQESSSEQSSTEQSTQSAAPSPSPTRTSSPSPTPTPSPSPTQTSSPAPSHWDDLSSELRSLLSEGAQLEPGFTGSGGDYWRAALQNPELTNSDGTVSTSKLASHVSTLRNQQSTSSESSSTSGSSSSSSSSGSSSSGSSSTSDSSSGSSTASSSTSSGSQPASSSSGSNAASIAVNWARNEATRPGTSYVLGANGPDAWDCSSFTQAAYRAAGVSLGRTTWDQMVQGQEVSWADRRPGDLIFWDDWHMAIYLGDGMMADAGNPRVGVSVRSVFGSPTMVRRVA